MVLNQRTHKSRSSSQSCPNISNTIFIKMRQNAHFETTTRDKNSKIVVEAKEKHVL